MTDLPIIESPTPRSSLRPFAAAMLRCLLCIAIAAGLRAIADTNTNRLRSVAGDRLTAVERDRILHAIDASSGIATIAEGLYSVTGGDDDVLATIATTQPQASEVTGYRGVSNIALELDESATVTNAFLLSSEDTLEHVEAILQDDGFFQQFDGWSVGNAASFSDIDAVSGATLTSLAIAESVMVRMGQEKPSLRFSARLCDDDIPLVFDDADGWTVEVVDSISANVVDASGQRRGSLVRTGPLVDSIAGYQGPTELLLRLNTDGVIIAAALRHTYDNQPYAGYLNDEPYFWKTFHDRTISELARVDVEAEQIEGVSGATMTSLAVADTLIAGAAALERRQARESAVAQTRPIYWSHNDSGTIVVLLLAVVIGATRLRGKRWANLLWNVILVGYFGLVTGNLISLAVLTGWAAKGVAWRFAPGLVTVVFVSLVLPPVTKRNLYCSHICPHGAAQQLLRKLGDRRWKLPRRLSLLLSWIPGITLMAAVVVTAMGADASVAAWEPFNAYIWYVAGIGSITVAIVSLALSIKIPMAYCRYACGTGRLLDYVRRTARSNRLHFADILAAIAAISLWMKVAAA